MKKITIYFLLSLLLSACSRTISTTDVADGRVVISLNNDWKFALGHSYDRDKDFKNGTSYFSYVTKAGYGDGPAAKDFDDRMWRTVSVPHDWCVELPFAENGSVSHGSKAIGRNYPESSVGWYRKSFFIDSADFGKKISVEFEGVFRDSKVWCNGFYLGNEPSGYMGFSYDLTEYLNYGGENVIAVRADASFEEGWFYEGAGIYRNVNLVKTNPLHVARYGTFITTDAITDSKAELTSRTKIVNESNEPATFIVVEKIINPDEALKNTDKIAFGEGQVKKQSREIHLEPHSSTEVVLHYSISDPLLWNVWDEGFPYLYRSDVCVYDVKNEKVVDTYQTHFGIRTIAFDADKGLLVNGKQVKARGVCLHQDHAGVGVAITPGLQQYRVRKMMDMGCNAIRTSHNPPAPDFLNVCDRLGVLVMDELRLMGINQEHKKNIEQLLLRDRNHPSVFIWSLGNEEWAIEGNEKGARIAKNMEQYAHLFDSSRAFTIATSGGWDTGIGAVTEVFGVNYLSHGDVLDHKKKFPNQSMIGTEEGNTERTRGIYQSNHEKCWMERTQIHNDYGMRNAWKFYDSLDWASGLFYWTGLDYRGEPTPYEYPAVVSQFGITDLCGFEKDNFYYLKSWWTKDVVLHIASNWDYAEGTDSVDVIVYSNCPQVELFVNKQSQGIRSIAKNDFATWKVKFVPGLLSAIGYNEKGERMCGEGDGKSYGVSIVNGESKSTTLKMHSADYSDVSIITVYAVDENDRVDITANNQVLFTIDGDVDMVYVGNGNPSSHEPEVFFSENVVSQIVDLKECTVTNLENRKEVVEGYNYSSWIPAFSAEPDNRHWDVYEDSLKVIRGTFNLDRFDESMVVTLFAKSIVEQQTIYVNGHELQTNIQRADKLDAIQIPLDYLKVGRNEYVVTGQKFRKKYMYDEPNREPGSVQIQYPMPQITRCLFNGYAQLIVKRKQNGKPLQITAKAEGKKENSVKVK
ncbi:MAG: DUF4982 domain-containing protein [Bacteroidales bacterium]|nr:DUF4982 domain-containing protein [Bacteroidales bacterium]